MAKKVMIILLIIFLTVILLFTLAVFSLRPLLSYLTRPADLQLATKKGLKLAESRNKTFLVVVAHPDDAEWYAGGTLALLAKNNKVILIIGTSGEKGAPVDNLGNLREELQERAGKVIGYKQIIFLRFPDRGLSESKGFQEKVNKLFKKFNPDAVFTFDPEQQSYIYRHSDHIAAGKTALATGKNNNFDYYLFHSKKPDVVVDYGEVKEKKRQSLQILSDYGNRTRSIWITVLRYVFRRRDGGEPFEWYGFREIYPEINVQYGEVFRQTSK